MGLLINYNGYGGSLDDLHFHPADLYRELLAYKTPMDFLSAKPKSYAKLEAGYAMDMEQAAKAEVLDSSNTGIIIALPDAASSRRISGVYGNQCAQDNPHKAHAILTAQKDGYQEGGYLVSIRAPLARRSGADRLALQFKTGGGRPAAAGINHLAHDDLARFIDIFRQSFG